MQAIRVHETGGPEVLRVDDIPEPTAGAGELLVEIQAVGVNFIEIYQREGTYKFSLPLTLGAEAAGVVRAIGSGVNGFKIRDRVVSHAFNGAYANLATVPADRAVHIPDGVTSKQAAAVFLQGLTAHYLSTSTYPLQHGDRALIHAAAGGVGLLLCQMAKKRGAFIIGTASTDEKRKLAREAGADEMIDYTTTDFADETRRLTDGAGVQVVYDSVGKTTFDKSLDCLATRGMMVLFGQSSGVVPPVDPQILNRKGSLFLTRPTLHSYVQTRDALVERSNELLGWVASGALHVRIDREVPLSNAADAQMALTGRKTAGKVLLIP